MPPNVKNVVKFAADQLNEQINQLNQMDPNKNKRHSKKKKKQSSKKKSKKEKSRVSKRSKKRKRDNIDLDLTGTENEAYTAKLRKKKKINYYYADQQEYEDEEEPPTKRRRVCQDPQPQQEPEKHYTIQDATNQWNKMKRDDVKIFGKTFGFYLTNTRNDPDMKALHELFKKMGLRVRESLHNRDGINRGKFKVIMNKNMSSQDLITNLIDEIQTKLADDLDKQQKEYQWFIKTDTCVSYQWIVDKISQWTGKKQISFGNKCKFTYSDINDEWIHDVESFGHSIEQTRIAQKEQDDQQNQMDTIDDDVQTDDVHTDDTEARLDKFNTEGNEFNNMDPAQQPTEVRNISWPISNVYTTVEKDFYAVLENSGIKLDDQSITNEDLDKIEDQFQEHYATLSEQKRRAEALSEEKYTATDLELADIIKRMNEEFKNIHTMDLFTTNMIIDHDSWSPMPWEEVEKTQRLLVSKEMDKLSKIKEEQENQDADKINSMMIQKNKEQLEKAQQNVKRARDKYDQNVTAVREQRNAIENRFIEDLDDPKNDKKGVIFILPNKQRKNGDHFVTAVAKYIKDPNCNRKCKGNVKEIEISFVNSRNTSFGDIGDDSDAKKIRDNIINFMKSMKHQYGEKFKVTHKTKGVSPIQSNSIDCGWYSYFIGQHFQNDGEEIHEGDGMPTLPIPPKDVEHFKATFKTKVINKYNQVHDNWIHTKKNELVNKMPHSNHLLVLYPEPSDFFRIDMVDDYKEGIKFCSGGCGKQCMPSQQDIDDEFDESQFVQTICTHPKCQKLICADCIWSIDRNADAMEDSVDKRCWIHCSKEQQNKWREECWKYQKRIATLNKDSNDIEMHSNNNNNNNNNHNNDNNTDNNDNNTNNNTNNNDNNTDNNDNNNNNNNNGLSASSNGLSASPNDSSTSPNRSSPPNK